MGPNLASDLVHRVHLRGSFLVTRAAWPHMKSNGFGRYSTGALSCLEPAVTFIQQDYEIAFVFSGS